MLLLMFVSQPLRAENSSVTVAAGVSGLSAQTWEPADAATEAQVNDWANNLSFGFTPNHGQVANIDGKTAEEVLFSANVQGAEVYVTTSGLSHYFLKRIKKGAKVWRPKGAAVGPKEFEWRRIDLHLTGAAIASERVTMEEPLGDLGVTHFYRSQRPEGVLDVPTYGKVTLAEVYRGIDWVVLSRPGGAVQHDFIVRPGADIAQIRMEYRGASSIEVSDDAARLRIRTELGEVQEGALHCFQADGAPVNGRFVVDGNIVTFAIDDYDRSQTLTAECTALGGQTFYPNQSCSTTTCSILCNVCGTKYNDLNKNGIQDSGEPGLAGWTIQLYYWNGPLYASTTTDGSGNYCFNDIPCGAWTVTEQLQPNWVQTFPSPNVHNYSMGTGQTISDADFGNASCIADTCCIKPAAGMIAWYPFDETAPGPANDIAARTRSGWHYADQFAHAEGIVNGAIALDSARYVRVSDDPFAQVDTGDFSIDVWLNPESFASECQNSPYEPCAAIPILDNRHAASGGSGNNGIMLYLKRVSPTQARLGLAMNVFPNAVDTFETPTAPVVLNEWQHIAVTVNRSTARRRASSTTMAIR